jgi:hypothetical protein
MTTMKQAAAEFLALKRIAVAGVSRTPAGHGSNVVYRRLRERGYEVFAVNPEAEVVEGDPCYHDLKSIPGGVDAVVIGTSPANADSVVRECHELGIEQVWMHRSLGSGSVSASAAEYCRSNGMSVIAGGCPLMYGPTSDRVHRGMCWVLNVIGAIPREV